MGSILDYNIDLFLDNISSRYNINRKELDNFKDYKREKLETYIEDKKIYVDNKNCRYILLENKVDNIYYAIKLDNK